MKTALLALALLLILAPSCSKSNIQANNQTTISGKWTFNSVTYIDSGLIGLDTINYSYPNYDSASLNFMENATVVSYIYAPNSFSSSPDTITTGYRVSGDTLFSTAPNFYSDDTELIQTLTSNTLVLHQKYYYYQTTPLSYTESWFYLSK